MFTSMNSVLHPYTQDMFLAENHHLSLIFMGVRQKIVISPFTNQALWYTCDSTYIFL